MRELRFSWHQTTVQGVETGKRSVSVDELFALAICLDTHAGSLLDPRGANVDLIDTGLPLPTPDLMFRWLIPLPMLAPKQPAWVDTAHWDDDRLGERAGESIQTDADDSSVLDVRLRSPLYVLEILETQVRELLERKADDER